MSRPTGAPIQSGDSVSATRLQCLVADSETTVPTLGAEETERVRTRVRLLVGLTTRAGRYRRGLVRAAAGLTPPEAAILADLEDHGMDVGQLRDVLCGGHVLIDNPALYERWRFPDVSRQRISSHHHSIDKTRFPDIGMRGPLVREKLHGRTSAGTWVQLEKTPATMGAGKLPTWTDVQHLADYVVYRVTRRNVGPWGLSHLTERRPMYLSPDLSTQVPLPASTARALAVTLARIDADEQAATASPDLATRFPPPNRDDPVVELTGQPDGSRGRGLFGSSQVWVTEAPPGSARDILGGDPEPPSWTLPPVAASRPLTVRVGDRRLTTASRVPALAAERSS